MRLIPLLAMSLVGPFGSGAALAQSLPTTSIGEMAATPLVRVNIAESLRTPPDEASLTVGTQAKAPTAKAAVALSKTKTEKLLAAIRAAGIRERDIQTQGLQLNPDYRYDPQPDGRGGEQRLVGYIATNSVLIKTRDVDALTSLLDGLTAAGADTVYGPNFSIADPAPLRREARVRAMARGEAEAAEYARNNGFTAWQPASGARAARRPRGHSTPSASRPCRNRCAAPRRWRPRRNPGPDARRWKAPPSASWGE